jgi:5-formyltetrahydrofolate cyclo-ligase
MPAKASPASQDKASLRARIRHARRQRSSDERQACRHGIAEHALAALERCDATTVACFIDAAGEPPTTALLQALWAQGMVVLTPRVHGPELEWVVTTPTSELTAGAYGIPEVRAGELGSLDDVQAMLIPALAIDHDGVRLGQGGGFYDRTLGGGRPHPPVLAVVFSDEDGIEVPREPHDMAVDAVITETGVRWVRPIASQATK